MSKIVAAGALKGGAGKTSLTMLLANWLHNVKKKKVLVLDCDTLQKTIFNSREESLERGAKEEDLYKVLAVNPKDAIELLEYVKEDYDFIFIDVPGNMMEEGVLPLYFLVDYLIFPTKGSAKDDTSAAVFLESYIENILPFKKENNLDVNIKGLMYMVNKKGIRYKDFKIKERKGEIPIPFFNSVVPHSEVLEDNYDTVKVSDYRSTNFDIKDLFNEMSEYLEI